MILLLLLLFYIGYHSFRIDCDRVRGKTGGEHSKTKTKEGDTRDTHVRYIQTV